MSQKQHFLKIFFIDFENKATTLYQKKEQCSHILNGEKKSQNFFFFRPECHWKHQDMKTHEIYCSYMIFALLGCMSVVRFFLHMGFNMKCVLFVACSQQNGNT